VQRQVTTILPSPEDISWLRPWTPGWQAHSSVHESHDGDCNSTTHSSGKMRTDNQ